MARGQVSSDPLVLFAETHGGHLKPIPRKKLGTSYLYYYYDGAGNRTEKYFPSGTPAERITQFIISVQGNAFSAKHGFDPVFAVEDKKRNRWNVEEMLDWYVTLRLKEKIPINHPMRESKIESAKTTLQSYEQAHKLLVRWLKEEKGSAIVPVESISREDLANFQRWLIGYDGGRGGNSATTIHILLRRLNTIFRKAVYEKKIAGNPFDGFEFVKRLPPQRREVLTLEEMIKVAETSYMRKNPDTLWAWHIARLTGIRGQDIRRLQWENFDWEKLEYDIYMTKLDRRIQVPFHPALAKYRDLFWKAIREKPKSGPMFEFKMRDLSIRFNYAILLVKGKTKFLRGSHTPRHSLATYLDREAKWPLDYVSTFLCHDSGNITLRYTHERLARLKEMIAGLPFE